MNRIEKKFQELKTNKQKAFIPFIVAGDPNLQTTKRIILAMEKKGADIIELGIAFSDPIADGPVIQRASTRALKKGVCLGKVMELVKDVRKKTEIPIILMTYYNPVFAYGAKKFCSDAVRSGVDGLIVPDMPPEESGELTKYANIYGLDVVFLLAPTSPLKRVKLICRKTKGFVYYVSLTGTTGMREGLADDIEKNLENIKKVTKKPVCVGFGISKPEHIKKISDFADGIIVGSAIVKIIENSNQKNCVSDVSNFMRGLVNALRSDNGRRQR